MSQAGGSRNGKCGAAYIIKCSTLSFSNINNKITEKFSAERGRRASKQAGLESERARER